VFHQCFTQDALKFEGYLLSRAKMPGANESNPDGNIEIRMLDNTESRA